MFVAFVLSFFGCSQCASGMMGIDYPQLVVFDLDACLWDQEMYEMSALPSRTVTGPLNGACIAA